VYFEYNFPCSLALPAGLGAQHSIAHPFILFYFRAQHRPHDDMGIAKGGLGPLGSSPIEFRRKLLRIKTITTAEFTAPLPGWQYMALSVMAAEIFIWGL